MFCFISGVTISRVRLSVCFLICISLGPGTARGSRQPISKLSAWHSSGPCGAQPRAARAMGLDYTWQAVRACSTARTSTQRWVKTQVLHTLAGLCGEACIRLLCVGTEQVGAATVEAVLALHARFRPLAAAAAVCRAVPYEHMYLLIDNVHVVCAACRVGNAEELKKHGQAAHASFGVACTGVFHAA